MHSIKANTAKSWVSDIELARIEALNLIIPDTSFFILNIVDGNDLDFWWSKNKNFTKAFSSIPDIIRKVIEAPTHIKSDGKINYGHFHTALHWQHIEKEIDEVLKGVFNFCLQDEVQKQIIRQAEVYLLIEVFKIRSKIWWLQKYTKTRENIK